MPVATLIATNAPYFPRSRPATVFDPRLVRTLRQLLLAGLVAVLLLPAARGYSAWLGWMPLWLVAMPLSALWAARGFRLPLRALAPAKGRRRRHPQARRRTSRGRIARLPRAA